MPIFVNEVEITDDEVHSEMQYHPAANVEEARYKAAQALVVRQLFLQEAREQSLLPKSKEASAGVEEEERAIEVLLEKEIEIPEADSKTCQHYYEHNKERFKDQKTGEVLPFETVEKHVRDYICTRSMRTGISQYISILAGQARIAGFDMEGSDSPLVQ